MFFYKIFSILLILNLVGFHLLIPSLSIRFCSLFLFLFFQVKSCPLLCDKVVYYAKPSTRWFFLYFVVSTRLIMLRCYIFLLFIIIEIFQYCITKIFMSRPATDVKGAGGGGRPSLKF